MHLKSNGFYAVSYDLCCNMLMLSLTVVVSFGGALTFVLLVIMRMLSVIAGCVLCLIVV